MWSRLQAALHRPGIDLTKIPLTMDAWLVAPSLRHRLHALGFTKIIMAGKSHYPFPIDGKKQEASPGKQALVRHDPTWGIDVPSCRVHAQSPTFGALLLVFFQKSKYLTKNNFIFFSEILEHVFHVVNQMCPAFISI